MPLKTLQIRIGTAEFLIFTKQAGENGIEIRVQDGTIWLSQKLMAALFDCTPENITMHLKNIFADGELAEISVTKDFLVTVADDKNYRTRHYSLDANIAVGYWITENNRHLQYRLVSVTEDSSVTAAENNQFVRHFLTYQRELFKSSRYDINNQNHERNRQKP